MVLTLEAPTMPTPPADALRAVYCRRCGPGARPLCEVGPGVVVIRHGRRAYTIHGDRAWARCPQCGAQQEIAIPTQED